MRQEQLFAPEHQGCAVLTLLRHKAEGGKCPQAEWAARVPAKPKALRGQQAHGKKMLPLSHEAVKVKASLGD